MHENFLRQVSFEDKNRKDHTLRRVPPAQGFCATANSTRENPILFARQKVGDTVLEKPIKGGVAQFRPLALQFRVSEQMDQDSPGSI